MIVFSLERLKAWILEERTVWGSQSSEQAPQKALENEVALASLSFCFKAFIEAIMTGVLLGPMASWWLAA